MDAKIHRCISHYVAKRILEHHCVKRLTQDGFRSDVQIGFIPAKGGRRSIASWEEMKATITIVLPSESSPNLLSLKETITGLEKEIQAPGTEAIVISSIFRAMLKNEKVSWCIVKHFWPPFPNMALGLSLVYLRQQYVYALKRLSEVTFVPPAYVDLICH
jgi:hypothetical protein